MESENLNQDSAKHSIRAFLLYVFIVGIAILILQVYWGYIGAPFFISILLGGLAQTLFRISKRMWMNIIKPSPEGEKHSTFPLMQAVVGLTPSYKLLILLFLLMSIVSAFWYAVGMGLHWVFH